MSVPIRIPNAILLTRVPSNDLLNLGVRYRRYLRSRVYFIPFTQELIRLIFTPLDLALFISKLHIRPPPKSLPKQEAIDILGAMIRALASHASSILSTPLNSTGIAVPDYFTAPDTSLVISALSSAGLGFIPIDWRFDQTASVAGTVSQGIGVCTDYRNRMACDSEWLPRETVLLLSFTNAALGLTLLLSGQGYLRKPFIADELHPELGLRALQNAKPVFDQAEQVAALRAEIKRLLIRENKYPSKIVLMGDQTHQIVFQDALRDSLTELQPIHGYSSVHIERALWVDRIVDPVFAGARGAAEMAKRAMESPPGGCLEAVHCYRERGE